MRAFHSNRNLKETVTALVSEIHSSGREIVPSRCSVDCPLHRDTLEETEQQLGIPKTILALCDSLNMALEYEQATFWYDRFIRSVWTGDLSAVFADCATYLFEGKNVGIIKLLSSDKNCALAKEVLVALQTQQVDAPKLHELKRKLIEFDSTYPNPTRMTSECEPAILLLDFTIQPNAKLGTDMLMVFAAQFQYAQKKGKTWRHLAKMYAEKFLDVLINTEEQAP